MEDALWDRLYDPMAFEFLDLEKARAILDVGCGSGLWTWTLLRLQKKASVVGLDLDKAALTRARKNLGRRASLVCADASSLPFRQGSFDLTTCRRLLINLSPRASATTIQEMKRVVKKGGTVCPIEPSLTASSATHFSTLRGGLKFSRRLEKMFSDTDFTLGPRVAHLLLKAGLREVKVRGYLPVLSSVPPEYHAQLLTSVVHEDFRKASAEVEGVKTHLRRGVSPSRDGRTELSEEAELLDAEMEAQKRKGSFVSIAAFPMFVAKGRKR